MNILVCGGRHFGEYFDKELEEWRLSPIEILLFNSTMNDIATEFSTKYSDDPFWIPDDFTIISGGAKGADTLAIKWAIENDCEYKVFNADWRSFGRAAGPIRNKQMLVQGNPDLVIAFPGGKGTAHMIMISKEANVPVRIIK